MTIDAEELERLEEEAAFAKNHIMLALIAELKKAQDDLDIAITNVVTMSHYRDRAEAERDTACALLRSADAMMAALASPNNPHINDLRARIDAFLEKRP